MRHALHRTRTLAVALGLTAAPTIAHACSVCMAGERRTLMAYFGTAVLLSVLPFVLFGGMAWWLLRQSRARQTGDGSVAQDSGRLDAVGAATSDLAFGPFGKRSHQS